MTNRFQKGQSGNPRGRPKGSKDWRAQVRAKLEGVAPELVDDLLRHAGKNLRVKLFLADKILPPARSAPIGVDLKLTGSPADRADAVVDALASGRLTLEEAKALLDALGAAQAIREANAIAERLEALERQLAALGGARDQP